MQTCQHLPDVFRFELIVPWGQQSKDNSGHVIYSFKLNSHNALLVLRYAIFVPHSLSMEACHPLTSLYCQISCFMVMFGDKIKTIWKYNRASFANIHLLYSHPFDCVNHKGDTNTSSSFFSTLGLMHIRSEASSETIWAHKRLLALYYSITCQSILYLHHFIQRQIESCPAKSVRENCAPTRHILQIFSS